MDILENKSWFFPEIARSPNGLDVIGVGCQEEKKKPGLKAKRSLDCYAWVHLTTGGGTFHSQSISPTAIGGGDMIFLFPGEWHFYYPDVDNPWTEIWMLFDGFTARAFQEQKIISPDNPIIRLKDNKQICKSFEKAVRQIEQNKGRHTPGLSPLLFEILSEIFEQQANPSLTSKQGGLHTLIKTIQEHPEKDWSFQELARAEHLSYELFRKRFLKATGLPPARFLKQERMKKACVYLADGLSVKETCQKIGMEDPYHFSRLFKNIIGKAPKHFAKSVVSWKKDYE